MLIEQLNKLDNDYAYLSQGLKTTPKKSSISNFLKIFDEYIEEIFHMIIDNINTDIQIDLENIFCDGTTFEAHNSRNKIITKTNIVRSNKKWAAVINDINTMPDKKTLASEKLKLNQERTALLSKLGRNSYGLTDVDSVIIKDKNNSFIAGYNSLLVEEAKYGMIIFTQMSNKNPDNQVFMESIDKLLIRYHPKTITLDKGYGSFEILKKLKDNKITGYVKTVKNDNSKTKLNFLSFELSEDENSLICPLGVVLPKVLTNKQDKVSFKMETCENCSKYENCFHVFKGRVTFNPEEYKLMKEAVSNLCY